MKKLFVCAAALLLMTAVPAGRAAAQDPITLIIQQAVTRVIVAVDLKIQRLQNEVIWLQNAQKVLENTMSELRLTEITAWVDKQKQLYEEYFGELWQVKEVLSTYGRLRTIAGQQQQLLAEYHKAWKAVQGDRHFTPEEIAYIGAVYSGMLQQSVKNLDGLALVIRSLTTQMGDGERLALINQAAEATARNLSDLRAFTAQNIRLSLSRAADEGDRQAIQRLYGL